MSRRLTCLPFVAVLLLGFEAKQDAPKPPLTADEQKLVEWTNKARAEKDLSPLKVNAHLTAAARGHSANMAKKGQMSHELDGKTPADRVKAAGYDYSYAGENIAVGENTPLEQVFKGWMESKPHRENILKPQYREIGVGVAKNDKGETYYTQDFGAARK